MKSGVILSLVHLNIKMASRTKYNFAAIQYTYEFVARRFVMVNLEQFYE